MNTNPSSKDPKVSAASMEEYFAYLEELRDSGETNMYGAIPYLQEQFQELRYDRQTAEKILCAWISSFTERQDEEQ